VIGGFETRGDSGIRGAGTVWGQWRAGRDSGPRPNGTTGGHRAPVLRERCARGAAPDASGGGWLTDLTVNAAYTLSSRVGLTVAYRHGTWTMLGAHDAYAVRRRSVIAGWHLHADARRRRT
jgi:hypothetical protein